MSAGACLPPRPLLRPCPTAVWPAHPECIWGPPDHRAHTLPGPAAVGQAPRPSPGPPGCALRHRTKSSRPAALGTGRNLSS